MIDFHLLPDIYGLQAPQKPFQSIYVFMCLKSSPSSNLSPLYQWNMAAATKTWHKM